MYSLIFSKMTRWWYHIPLVFYLVGGKKKENYYLKLIYEMTEDVVAKRKRCLTMNNNLTEDANQVMGVVDRFILSGELSDKEIICETFSLFTTVSYLCQCECVCGGKSI